MIKKTLLTLGALFAAVAVFGQSNYYYVRYDGATDVGYDVNKIITDGAVVLQSGSNDVLSAEQTIPFTWKFYGNDVTKYKVSDNGYITFDMGATTSESYNTGIHLPDADFAPHAAIFGLWDDLWLKPLSDYPSVKTDIRSYTYGDAPNRVHVIQWLAASPKGTIPTNTGGNWMYFGIRLYESGDFDVIYGSNNLPKPLTATIGVQNADGTVGMEVSGSPSLSFPQLLNGYAMYRFKYGAQPQYDVEGLSLNMYNYVSQTEGAPISMTIHNLGSEPITSAEMTFTAEGKTFTKDLGAISVAASGGYATVTFPDKWMPVAHGSTVTVDAWISKINGNADMNTDNDKVTHDAYVAANLVKRKVFVEEFTQASCPPCAAQNPNFNATLDANGSLLSAVKYQTSWPGIDPMNAYNSGDVQTRVSFYGINAVPMSRIDGLIPVGAAYAGAPYNVSAALLSSESAKPATFDIKTDITKSDKTYNFNVTLTSKINTPNAYLKMYAAVVEEPIIYASAPGTNGETEFRQVMRKMLPNAGGTTVGSMGEGDTKNFSLSYTTDNVVKINNLRLVVWVQDPTSKEVHNSYWTSPEFSTGIQPDNENSIITGLYPNPATEMANLQFNLNNSSMVNAQLVDLTGRVVKNLVDGEQMQSGAHNVQIDLSALPKGIYLVNMNADGQHYTQKLIVQ